MKPIALIAVCLAALFIVEPVLADEDAELRRQMEELTKEVKGLRERVTELEGEPAPEAVNIEEGSIGEAIQQMAGSNVDAPRTTTLVIGGQIRVQPLWYSNRDLDSQTSDALEFVILRTRIHLDFDIAETLRAFVEIQDSRTFGEEGGVLAALEGLDLLQGFVDFRNIFGDGWLLRVGRQRMSYGAQRVISDLDWSPVGRAWDGVWLEYETETVDARLFLTRIDENLLTTGVSEEEDFYGIGSSNSDLTCSPGGRSGPSRRSPGRMETTMSVGSAGTATSAMMRAYRSSWLPPSPRLSTSQPRPASRSANTIGHDSCSSAPTPSV